MAEATVSAASMRIVRLLVGNPPQTVADLIKNTGVTRTAVTEQLNELVGAGFVERTVERLPGRGRPRHLYSATQAAMVLLFASNQRLVVPAMWRAIEELGGESLSQRVAAKVSDALAEHYRSRLRSADPQARLRELADVLNEEGALIEIEQQGDGLVMRKRSCGFTPMFDAKRNICAVDEALMSTVIGRPVRRVSCRHDGAPCCTFEIVSENGR